MPLGTGASGCGTKSATVSEEQLATRGPGALGGRAWVLLCGPGTGGTAGFQYGAKSFMSTSSTEGRGGRCTFAWEQARGVGPGAIRASKRGGRVSE